MSWAVWREGSEVVERRGECVARVPQEPRSNGEGSEVLDWHRTFCKRQRERLRESFDRASRRVTEARWAALEDVQLPRAGKKPSLEDIEARWR